MKNLHRLILITLGSCSLLAALPGRADIIISEVMSSESASYNADWFELTNTGGSPVNISGWKMDDNSNSFALSVGLTGVASIGAGQSAIFIEGTATTISNFETAWFGSAANTPAGFLIGNYSGSGVGLSSTADAVNVFDSTGTLITRVDFGAATTGVSFDNSIGLNNTTISTLSSAGVHGAVVSPSGEIGSPGAVPEPGTYALVIGGLALFAGFRIVRRLLAA